MPEPRLFRALTPEPRVGWRWLAVGSALHAAAIAILMSVPIIVVREWEMPEPDSVIEVVMPEEIPEDTGPILPSRPFRRPQPVEAPPTEPTVTVVAPVPPPEIVRREDAPPPTARPERRAPQVAISGFDPPKAPVEPAPKKVVRTNLFDAGSSAKPTLEASIQRVQTGGFGDPSGSPATETTRNRAAPTRLGSFDLPVGAGQGNGTAGAAGLRGAVSSAGFGSGIAAPRPEGASAPRGSVRSAGFAETTAAPEPARPRSRPVETPSTPIEILSKPKPSYTEEARAVRVEGEVVLEVRFGASGRTEVLRVVSGLGHGLDESAKRAAEQIVFKPARHDGEPVDFTALVRMVFQLT